MIYRYPIELLVRVPVPLWRLRSASSTVGRAGRGLWAGLWGRAVGGLGVGCGVDRACVAPMRKSRTCSCWRGSPTATTARLCRAVRSASTSPSSPASSLQGGATFGHGAGCCADARTASKAATTVQRSGVNSASAAMPQAAPSLQGARLLATEVGAVQMRARPRMAPLLSRVAA